MEVFFPSFCSRCSNVIHIFFLQSYRCTRSPRCCCCFFYTPRRYSTFMWSINFIGSVTYSLCMEFDGRALNCKAYNIYLSIIKCETHSKIIKLDHISAIVYKLQSKLYLLDLYKLDFNSIRRMALLIILWLSNQTIVLSQLTF